MQGRTSQLAHCAVGAIAFLIAVPLKWLTLKLPAEMRPMGAADSFTITGLTGYFGVNSFRVPLWTLLGVSIFATAGVATNLLGLTHLPRFLAVTLLVLTGLSYLSMFFISFIGNNDLSFGPVLALLGTVVVVWIGLERD